MIIKLIKLYELSCILFANCVLKEPVEILWIKKMDADKNLVNRDFINLHNLKFSVQVCIHSVSLKEYFHKKYFFLIFCKFGQSFM